MHVEKAHSFRFFPVILLTYELYLDVYDVFLSENSIKDFGAVYYDLKFHCLLLIEKIFTSSTPL